MNSFRRLFHRPGINSSFRLYLYLSLFALAFPFLAGLYPIVRFTQEQIDIEVHPEYVSIKGYYVYENPLPFPVAQGFSIPLPVDSDHPMPVQISAKQLFPEEKPIPLRFLLGKHRFEMAFSSKEEVIILVQYRQQAPKKNARYILTTTKSWKNPLIQGVYKLFPEGVKIVSSNYPLQPEESGALIFLRKNFMPEADWNFSWGT